MSSLNAGGEVETQEILYGKTIAQIDRKAPSSTDLTVVGDPATGISGAATVAETVKAGLPSGHAHADLLAWSTDTSSWAPLPAELVVQFGMPRGSAAGDLLAWSESHGQWAPIPLAPMAAGLAAGAKGSIPYQDLPDHTSMLPVGTTGQVLTVSSDGVPVWENSLPAMTVADKGKTLKVKADGSGLEWVA